MVQILIECKKYGDALSMQHTSQLFRYFSATKARIAILTNGSQYQFYTDLDHPNIMDEKPFLILDLENIDEHLLPELQKLTKEYFDVESIVSAAEELKYVSQIKKILADQFVSPDSELIKFFTHKVYDGLFTAKIKDSFANHIKRAMNQFLVDSVNSRLKLAIASENEESHQEKILVEVSANQDDSIIEPTQEEMDGFNIVRAILRQKFNIDRIVARNAQSYFSVLLDDNNRKPLCRLYLRFGKKKYITIIDENKEFTKYEILTVDDIFKYSEQLLIVPQKYEE